jgi:hypothetical protein
MRAALRFRGREIILDCFQKGRISQWARAHFFVGRENGVRVGLPMEGGSRCRARGNGTRYRFVSWPVKSHATGKDS